MDTVDPQQKIDFQLIENIPFTTAKVIGSRASIGMVVLASDYTIEHEFRTLIDMPGVDVFEARIRNDPQVIKEIQRWWFAARRDDSNNDNCLDEGEYSVFYQRIVFAFK